MPLPVSQQKADTLFCMFPKGLGTHMGELVLFILVNAQDQAWGTLTVGMAVLTVSTILFSLSDTGFLR